MDCEALKLQRHLLRVGLLRPCLSITFN